MKVCVLTGIWKSVSFTGIWRCVIFGCGGMSYWSMEGFYIGIGMLYYNNEYVILEYWVCSIGIWRCLILQYGVLYLDKRHVIVEICVYYRGYNGVQYWYSGEREREMFEKSAYIFFFSQILRKWYIKIWVWRRSVFEQLNFKKKFISVFISVYLYTIVSILLILEGF